MFSDVSPRARRFVQRGLTNLVERLKLERDALPDEEQYPLDNDIAYCYLLLKTLEDA